jgi:hypothetical protein
MHSTEGSRDPAPLDALGGVLVFGASDTLSDGTERSARRKARASSTIAADCLGRRHQNENDALRNTNGRDRRSPNRCRPTLSGRTRSPSLLRWIKLSLPPLCGRSKRGTRARSGGGKRDGADRAVRLRSGAGGRAWRCRTFADGLIADLVSQIGQRPDDTVITPVMVFPSRCERLAPQPLA